MMKLSKCIAPAIVTICLAVLTLTGCASTTETVNVTGKVWYRERIALPDNAVLTVQLQDISKQDVAADVIAEMTQENAKIPAEFNLVVEKDKLQERRRYGIRARITLDGKLIYTNAQAYVVDVNELTPVSVMVRRVGN